jgi:hypothetical protein
MKTFSLLFLAIFIAGVVPPKSNDDKMSSFKWLVGTWTANTSEGRLMETWLPMSDSSFSGETTLYKKTTETVPLESIQLICRNKQYYFIPTMPGKQPVEFRITAMNKNSFTAENADHDFPKRIMYTLYKKDSLHAVIDGGKGSTGKKQDYFYGRYHKPAQVKPVKKG